MRNLLLQFHNSEPLPQRNDLWARYNDLGKLPGNAWRKEKLWQELKAAGVEQRFSKTVCKPGYNFYSMHPALRDILFANGLMKWEEWRSGKLSMNLEEWKSYLADFRMTVEPMGPIATVPDQQPVDTQGTNKAHSEYKEYKAKTRKTSTAA